MDKVDDGQKGHGVVHQREIVIQNELDDIFVIEKGLERERQDHPRGHPAGSRRRQDGIRVHAPEEVLGDLKYHAE